VKFVPCSGAPPHPPCSLAPALGLMDAGRPFERTVLDSDSALSRASIDLGKAVINYANGCILPIFWGVPQDTGQEVSHSATGFVQQSGDAFFAVTAAHVYRQYLADRASLPRFRAQLGNIRFDFQTRLIALDYRLDIVTFTIDARECRALNRDVIPEPPGGWPPSPPFVGEGVFFSGYPGKEREVVNPDTLGFGIYSACLQVGDVTPRTISLELQRDDLIDTFGLGMPPKGYQLGGLSGSPVFAISAPHGIVRWRPVGVIFEVHPTFEVVLASRLDAIRPDGTFNHHET
jgi:hypothetical protein